MNQKKLRFALIAGLIFLTSLTFTLARNGTYAWFTSESSASGVITNATTSDLLRMKGDIQYGENCQVSSTVTIQNISTIDIPFSLELISKNGGTDVISKTLHPNESFTSPPNKISQRQNDCTIKQIEYDLTALNSYIDEPFILSVDQEKLKATVKPPPPAKADTNTETIEDESTASETEKAINDPSLPPVQEKEAAIDPSAQKPEEPIEPQHPLTDKEQIKPSEEKPKTEEEQPQETKVLEGSENPDSNS
ncbi:hypothetical protein JOC86_001994 [Bacillus pakistanensis]|uniref:Uncharacterized protein n=1 Tax=Rossellomorea pakistanensis TaxID=992288 RepID=A0ABS2NC63_9BACI|nr:hypothetical protein [Bacillus pakistanensis]MBM7585452.1 hypothetical protein [Bacillus pakistanensis]